MLAAEAVILIAMWWGMRLIIRWLLRRGWLR
jgi:hypothetical protein